MLKSEPDFLFNLVKSLSPSEKRYYQLHLKEGDATANLKLFNAISKATEMDDDKLFKALGQTFKDRNHYNVQKVRLKNSILKVMQIYRLDDTEDLDNILHNEIQNILFLIKKNLLEDAHLRLQKAKETAANYQKFIYVCHLDRIGQQILISRSDREAETLSRELIGEALINTEKLASHLKVMDVQQRHQFVLHGSNISKPESLSKLVSLKNLYNVLLKEESFFRHSVEARLEKLNLEADIILEESNGTNQRDDACKRRIADLFEAQMQQFLSNERDRKALEGLKGAYLVFLHRYASASMEDNIIRGEAAAQRLIEFSTTNEYMQRNRDALALELLVWAANNWVNKEKFMSALSGFRKSFDKNEKKVHQQIRMSVYHYLAFGFLVFGMYRDSISMFEKIIALNEENPSLRYDLAGYARIGLVLVAHEQQRSSNTIRPLVKEALAYIEKKAIEIKPPKLMFEYILKHAKNEAGTGDLQTLVKGLDECEQANANPFTYFEFKEWFEAKLPDADFGILVRKKYNLPST